MARKTKGIRRNEKWRDQDVPAVFRPGFLERLDGRTEIAKSLRARFDEVVADLGGLEDLSGIRVSLLERFVFLERLLAKLEEEMAQAPDSKTAMDIAGKWAQCLNTFTGLARTLGLDRKAKTLDLNAYLNGSTPKTNGSGRLPCGFRELHPDEAREGGRVGFPSEKAEGGLGGGGPDEDIDIDPPEEHSHL
jgi:hypothetical protein